VHDRYHFGVARPSGAAERHKSILDAAADLFYTHSFAAVGMDAIGERAGVTGPAVYRHFSGKQEILATLFDEAIDGLMLATGRSFDDPWEELAHLVRGHTQFVLDQRKLAGVKIREERSLAGPARKRLHDRERRYIERWVACVSRCRPELRGERKATDVHATIGMLNSVATWPPEALRTRSIPDEMVELVFRGLDNRAEGRRHPDAIGEAS
jgi:AcrR family transcriptional regulator